MKRLTVLFVVTLMMSLLAGVVSAEEKIAVVSLQRALHNVNEGKKVKTDLQQEYDTKKKQIDAMKLDLDKMGGDLEKQKMVLSQEALETKRKDLQTKFLDLQNKAATYQRELMTKESESAQKILTKLRDVVLQVSKEGGYTLVLENSTDTVLYSTHGEDITDRVIAAYNKVK